MKKNILFLCTGNSCRSQMAEGLLRFYRSEDFNAFSAGTKKHGLNENALKVLLEIGIDISHHQSKTLDELEAITFDYVFTVCSDAHETCPFFSHGKIIHVGFDDPPRLALGLSDTEEVLSVYRRVRDEIKDFIFKLDMYL